MHVLQQTFCKINIVDINDHGLSGLKIFTAAVVPQTKVFHEYEQLQHGSSIHASGQLEWFHTQVDECSMLTRLAIALLLHHLIYHGKPDPHHCHTYDS